MAKSLSSKGMSANPYDTPYKAHAGGHKKTRHKGRKAMKSRFAHLRAG